MCYINFRERGSRGLRVGYEEGLESVSVVASGGSSATKNEEELGCEERDDKNATTSVTNN
jgi:hypothetical protein